MKSTGEVMGVDHAFAPALTKALIASDLGIEVGTPFLLSLSNQTTTEALPLIRALHKAGCPLFATEGTASLVAGLGIPVQTVTKLLAGHPNVVDAIRDGDVRAVINTIEGGRDEPLRDGFHIRRAATEQRIPCFTSLDTARAAINSLADSSAYSVRPLLEYRDGVPAPEAGA
jgi:carbamoyl-phosphate synthase large subunit